jgi:hypothetical protein
MKKARIIIPFAAAVVTTACVPMYGAGMHGMPSAYAYRPPAYGPSVSIAAGTPVGRWDNVMMLPQGTSIEVLTADGQRTTAAFVSATNASVRVQSTAGEADIPAETVIRIDRWYGGPAGARSVARDAAKGAAVGAGAMGVLGLLAGVAPPARVVAAGAITGAYSHAEAGRAMRTTVTVYLASSVVPAFRPAYPSPPRQQ